MRFHRKKIRKVVISLSFFFLLCVCRESQVQAKEELYGRSLIQGITQESEWEGLLTLGLLETQTLTEPNIDTAMEKVIPSVVRIQSGTYLGSGSIFQMQADSVILVSSRHLLMYDNQVKITFIDGTETGGKTIGISEQYDVGFVQVMLSDIPYPTRKKIAQINADLEMAEQLDFGSDIFLIGSADGVGNNKSVGTVLNPWEYFEEFSSYMLNTYCAGKPGMSGCGTFDAYGNYVGMLTGGLGEKSASLPLSIILEEYESL